MSLRAGWTPPTSNHRGLPKSSTQLPWLIVLQAQPSQWRPSWGSGAGASPTPGLPPANRPSPQRMAGPTVLQGQASQPFPSRHLVSTVQTPHRPFVHFILVFAWLASSAFGSAPLFWVPRLPLTETQRTCPQWPLVALSPRPLRPASLGPPHSAPCVAMAGGGRRPVAALPRHGAGPAAPVSSLRSRLFLGAGEKVAELSKWNAPTPSQSHPLPASLAVVIPPICSDTSIVSHFFLDR